MNRSSTKVRLVFLIEFQNSISRNTGKCKLGGFSHRQSHKKESGGSYNGNTASNINVAMYIQLLYSCRGNYIFP